MPAQVKRTLDEVVREYLFEKGENTEAKYARTLQIAISGLRDFHLDDTGIPKTVVLPVNKDDMTVDLPDDYIKYTKIGVCGSDGNFHSMGINTDICLRRETDKCGNPILTQDPQAQDQGLVAAGPIFFTYGEGLSDNIRNGEYMGRFFGLGGGNNFHGQYKIDGENGTIQLSTDIVADKIHLEYLADLTKIKGQHRVHPYAVEALKAWIHWKEMQRNRSYSGNEKEQARRDYYNERRIMRARYNAFTVQEALQTIRTAFKMAPKM